LTIHSLKKTFPSEKFSNILTEENESQWVRNIIYSPHNNFFKQIDPHRLNTELPAAYRSAQLVYNKELVKNKMILIFND
jgi:hypothetical protein